MKLATIITTLLYTSFASSYVKADNNNNNIQSPDALEALADQFKEMAAILFESAHEADTLSKYTDHFTPAEIKDGLQRILESSSVNISYLWVDSKKIAEMLGDDVGDDIPSKSYLMDFHKASTEAGRKVDVCRRYPRWCTGFVTEEFAIWKGSVNNALDNAGTATTNALGNAKSSTRSALGNAGKATATAIDNAESSTRKAFHKAPYFASSQRKLFRDSSPLQAATGMATTAAASSVATANTAAAYSCSVAAEALENASKVTGDALSLGTAATYAAAETAIHAADVAAEIAEASVGFTVDLAENVLNSLLW